MSEKFKREFGALSRRAHTISINNGFDNSDIKEGLLLVHSEVSEACEALLANNPRSVKIAGFSNLEEELADITLRVMVISAEHGLDTAGATVAKLKYNSTRPHKHRG